MAACTCGDDSDSVDSVELPNCRFDCNYANTMDNFVQFDFHMRHLFGCSMKIFLEFPVKICATRLLTNCK